MSFVLKRTVRTSPTLPFEKILKEVMGPRYDLTLVFIGDARSRALNRAYRKKDYVPNVLSFPLSETTGEMYINPNEARRQSDAFGMSPKKFIGYLFIHGLLHLKGHTHGATMDKAEARYTKRYGFS